MKKILFLALFLTGCEYWNKVDVLNVKITDKNLYNSKTTNYYRIYTKNETFAIKDTFIHWRFNSSDLYANIETGKCYDLQVFWFRSPFFNEYRNILQAKEIECNR
jgi:hypothetical protein